MAKQFRIFIIDEDNILRGGFEAPSKTALNKVIAQLESSGFKTTAA